MSTEQEVLVINSAITQLMRQLRRLDEQQGIGRARLSALAVLHFVGECSLTELADQEIVSRATMHHILKGLEQEGHVRRTSDKADGRREIIKLTKKGKSAILRAHGSRIDFLSELVKGFDADDIAATARTLDKMRLRANGLA